MATDATRRSFLAGAGALALGTALPRGAAATDRPTAYAGCAATTDGGYRVAGLDAQGTARFAVTLPARGHGLTFDPTGRSCVAFARRPGYFALVVDADSGQVHAEIAAARDRHFNGHGCFAADGSLLFATEHHIPTGAGVLGVYAADEGYRRIGEFPTQGIDAHEVRLMPDGRTLVVANGGIETNPDQPRAKLNLDSMAPNLAYIDATTGAALEVMALPASLHQLSIRHLDVDRTGQVAIAMQYEGERRDHVPLVALHRRGAPIRPLLGPVAIDGGMQQYTGSIAFDPTGAILAVTSPRGGALTTWDARAGTPLGQLDAPDISGVAAAGADGLFLASSGDGTLRRIAADGAPAVSSATATAGLRWDNHLSRRPA